MRPNWYGVAGWLCLALALLLALFVIPYPHNGYALIAIALGVVGGVLIAHAVRGDES